MKKNGLWNLIKGELIYWFLVIILSGFFFYLTIIGASRNLLIATGALNILLLETWFLRTFLLYSGRKISQYSEVIQRISFKDRFFDYFVLPAIFLSTFMIYLYYNKNIVMSYWIIVVCMTVLLILFVNVKSSLKRIYRISSVTKGIFDLVGIITFYLSINLLIRLDLQIWTILSIIFVLALLILLSELQLHDRLTMSSFFISIISALFVVLSIGVFLFQSIFVATAIGTVAIYLIISLWNIRFSGKYKLLDYFPPFLYGVIALILIFNL
jgi:hypothetical protein